MTDEERLEEALLNPTPAEIRERTLRERVAQVTIPWHLFTTAEVRWVQQLSPEEILAIRSAPPGCSYLSEQELLARQTATSPVVRAQQELRRRKHADLLKLSASNPGNGSLW